MKNLHKILKVIALVIIFSVFVVSLLSIDLNYKISGNEEVIFHYVNENYYQDFSEDNLLDEIKEYSKNQDSLKDINTTLLEELVLANKYVKKAEVYLTVDQVINVYIHFREPFVKVLKDNKMYYYDIDGVMLPTLSKVKNLLIFSGEIEGVRFTDFVKIAKRIYNSNMLNDLIGGVYYEKEKGYVLSSKICDLAIYLGHDASVEFEKKSGLIELFSVFLSKELGCEYCKAINLQFDNQIICVK